MTTETNNQIVSLDSSLLDEKKTTEPKLSNKKLVHAFQKNNKFGKGRAIGSKNKATIELEAIGEENAQMILHRTIDLAISGDVAACKLILDRVYKVRKGFKWELDVPSSKTLADVNVASLKVTEELFAGNITAEEAVLLHEAIGSRMQVIKAIEIDARLEALEEMYNLRKKSHPTAGDEL